MQHILKIITTFADKIIKGGMYSWGCILRFSIIPFISM